jgi:hypothetical protein
VGLGWRGWCGLEGAGGRRWERAPSALPRGVGSQCWRGTGAAAPSAGGADMSAQGWIGRRGGAGRRGRMGGRGGTGWACRMGDRAGACGWWNRIDMFVVRGRKK